MRLALLLLAPCLAACGSDPQPPALDGPEPVVLDSATVADAPTVTAEIAGRVSGTVRLVEYPTGTRIRALVQGLGRDERHGFQILDGRTCDGADPSIHLGHGTAPHGSPDALPARRHAGDLGNLVGDDRGGGRYDRVDPVVRLSGPLSAVGRAIVIRAGQDDGFTPPDGSAGDILGCGVLSP